MVHSTAANTRLGALDFIRGLAVLGVFVMNVRDFSMHLRTFDDPLVAGGALAPNLLVWFVGNFVFADKMIAILSMLFGVGMVLIHEKAANDGTNGTAIHLRRQGILFLLGMVHAYGLWFGDILNTYALCGLLLWPLRRLSAVRLLAIGAVIYGIAVVFRQWPDLYRQGIKSWLFDSWSFSGEPGPRPAPMTWAQAYAGSWWDLARWRAWLNWRWHFEGFVSFNGWRCAGAMAIGMGLMKLRFFQPGTQGIGRRLMAWGYGMGVPLVLMSMHETLAEHRVLGPKFGFTSITKYGDLCAMLGCLGMALGHSALLVRVYQVAKTARWASFLGAVGRMALTCYITQTVVAVLVFDGWALAQWNRWSMVQQIALVVTVNTLLVLAAPVYLARFGQGPLERLWRAAYRRKPAVG